MPLGVNFRSTSGYVTDPSGFVAQTDFTLYTPSRGYGYIVAPSGGKVDRSNSIDPQIAGIHYGTNAFSFRIDLPNGAGRYRVRAAHCDAISDNPTGFRYWDGQQEEIAFVEGTTYDDSYQTILGNHPAKAQFSKNKEDYVEHVFESGHLIIERDPILDSGNGVISSVWVEHITSTSHEGLGGEHLWVCPSISNSKDDISGHNITTTLNGGMSIVSDTTNGGSKAFEFDGTDDYVSTNMQGELDFFQRTGVWAVAAWVKCDDGASTASQGLVGSLLGDTGYGMNLRMSNSTSEGLRGDVPKNTSNQYITNVNEGSAWPDSNWHHIAFVSDGRTATLYRDGTSIATQTLNSLATANQQETTNVLLFGAYHSSGSAAGFLDGRMDDIRIFRRQITQSEITRLASHRGILGPALPEGLGGETAWLCPTITGNNADIARSGTPSPKYIGNAEVVSSTGANGLKAFDFSGAERVTLDQKNAFEHGKSFSLSVWVKVDPVPSQFAIIAAKMENTGDWTGWELLYHVGEMMFIAIKEGGTGYRVQGHSPTGQVTTDWQHFVCTWDGTDTSGLNIYIDGVKQAISVDYNNFGTGHFKTHEPFTLGGRSDDSNASQYSLYGQIDDFRAYGRILNEAEISHLSQSRGVTGKPKTYRQVVEDSVTYVPLQEQATTVYCKQTNIAGTLSDTSTSSRFVEGPTKNLPNAIKFVASSSRKITFASVPSGLAGMTKYTVSAWVKCQITSTAQRTVVSFEGTASTRSYRFTTHVSASTQKGPSFFHANSQIITRNTLDNTNKWQHVVVTVDTTNGTRQTYIDGQLDAEATGTAYAAVHSTLNYFCIGAKTHGGAGEYHDAAIAGVGIWDKILTPQEINALYSEYKEELVGLRTEKLWIVPTRTKDRSNVMYPATANTELSGSLSIVDDVSDGGTKAIQFNDSDAGNYLEWDDNTDSDPVTISFWLEGSELYNANDIPALIGKSASSALRLYTDPGDMMGSGQTLGFSADSNWHTGSSWADNPYGMGGGTVEWHHVAIVRDYQTNTKFYVDGSLVHTGSANDTTAGAWTAASYFIGVDKSTGVEDNNFLGKLDDFRVIDGAATAGEIAHLAKYRGILGGPYIECDAGEFNVTGNNVSLHIPVKMTASTATFTLTGQIAHGNWVPPGLGTELMWVCPTYTGDRSNLAPSQNATTTSGTLSVINDTTNQGLRAFDCTVLNSVSNYWRFNYGSSRPGTLTFWMKKASTGHYWNTLARRVIVGNAVQVQILSSTQSNGNYDTLNFWNDGTASNTSTSFNGTWHHIVMERDFGGTNRFFVDGVAYGSYTGSAGSNSDEFAGVIQFIASPSQYHTSGQYNFTGLIDDIRLFDTQLTSYEISHLASRRGAQGAAPTSVSMSADVATFTLTGQAATLKENVNLSASAGSFTLTGVAAQLNVKMSLAAGAFTLSGQAAGLTQQVKMSAGVGSFALSGQAADLVYAQKIAAGTGAFSLTGVNASLAVATNLTAGVGSFTLTGNATDGLDIKLRVQSGGFALTGNSAALQTSTSQQLPADAGSFAVTPQNTTVLAVEINQTAGAFAVTGVNAPLHTKMVTSAASFSVAGQSAFLGLTFELAVGTFQVSGTSLPPIPGTQRPTPYYYRFLMQDE